MSSNGLEIGFSECNHNTTGGIVTSTGKLKLGLVIKNYSQILSLSTLLF